MAGMNKICLGNLHAMSDGKVFATQDGWPAGQPARQTNTTDYIDLYVTHLDQNCERNHLDGILVGLLCLHFATSAQADHGKVSPDLSISVVKYVGLHQGIFCLT